MENKECITFRFVPTMRCNFKCSYCFLRHSDMKEPTMFDCFSVNDWIRGIKNYAHFNVDFYMWGGEPFCIKETFDFVSKLDTLEFVKSIRIDTNMSFYDKILEKCPSSKLRLNGSWHPHKYSLEQIEKRAFALHQQGLLCMLNFVASDENILYLKESNLDLLSIVRKFADQGIYLNVAADFAKGNDDTYRKMITQYTTEEDWKHIHNEYPPHGVLCDSGSSFITINPDGTLTSCGRQNKKYLFFGDQRPKVLGNLFDGTLERVSCPCPQQECPSIISYVHRCDNEFVAQDHLKEYVYRNIKHRRKTGVYSSDVFTWL